MGYQAIYRKWRPLVFEDIVGQSHVTRTLKNQIINGHVSHAYLFCGTRGTGKTTAAKVFARAVNCKNPKDGSPCNECEICRGILDGSIMDVSEIDAASNNGVDNIRELREDVNYVATHTKYRVYIIDEVHMLSDGAFNALLKTLEEPPEHVIFILATTEAHKVPETIMSRCQRFDFKRIRNSDIIARMKEVAYGDGLKISDDAFALLARLADGSMRDGLSILERCVSACGDTLEEKDISEVLGIAGTDAEIAVTDAMISGNVADVLSLVGRLSSQGRDLNLFIDGLILHLRNLVMAKLSDAPEELIDCSAEMLVKIKAQAQKLSYEKLSHSIELLNAARNDAKYSKSPATMYEIALIQLVKPSFDDSKEALLDRINDLEEKVKNGITVAVKTETKKEEAENKKPKEKPSARLYVPLDVSKLTAESDIVVCARKWDAVAASVAKKCPHVAQSVIKRQITIDGEGLILVFNKNERMLKKIASTYAGEIKDVILQVTGFEFAVKTAFLDDIEDNIIDYWSIKSNSDAKKENDTIPSKNEVINTETGADPIDNLIENFPEIVEVTDSSEFLEYNPENENYEQSEMEESGEEFLSDEEKRQIEEE